MKTVPVRVEMKMAPVSLAVVVVLLLLLLCCSASTAADPQCGTHAAVGTSLSVPLNHALKSTDRLQWRHNTTVIFHKNKDVIRTGKAGDISTDGSLKLTNLNMDMSGTYTPEVFDGDGVSVKKLKVLHLCVIAPVKKPSVGMQCSSDKKKVTFTCKSDDKSPGYKWLQNDKELTGANGSTLVKVARDVSSDKFTCQVSNQVSKETSKPAIQTCYTSLIPDTLFGYSIWIFVGGGAGIVVVLIIIVIVCCVKAKKKKRMRLKDEEELRLGWSNTPQQPQQGHHEYHQPSDHHHHHQPSDHHHHHQHPQHHPHHHHPQHPAGHTGPRQHGSKQPRKPRPRASEPTTTQPQPSPRRPAQVPVQTAPADDEQPPPLPNPRKKGPRTQRQ